MKYFIDMDSGCKNRKKASFSHAVTSLNLSHRISSWRGGVRKTNTAIIDKLLYLY